MTFLSSLHTWYVVGGVVANLREQSGVKWDINIL